VTPKEAFIALNLVSGIGPATVRQLVARFGGPGEALQASEAEIATVPGIGPAKAKALTAPDLMDRLSAELDLMTCHGAIALTQDDAEYPARLKELKDAPVVLYVKGDLSSLKRAGERGLAVIGTRMHTNYGERMATQLAGSAARAGWIITSGMAKGIDSVAHWAAIDAGGRTVAVQGCGLTHVYPQENVTLAHAIAENGCLVSEQPMTVRPDRRTFPMRNRIVAGMSEGTLVVEAGTGSGSMITATLAMKAGRHVFAVPGRVDSPYSKGCHELIRRGAKLTETLDDVQNALTFLPGFTPDTAPSRTVSNERRPFPDLDDDERAVAKELEAGEATVDALTTRVGMPVHRLLSLLMQMELKRIVKQLPGKRFVLNT
jgi:DNA processing protein